MVEDLLCVWRYNEVVFYCGVKTKYVPGVKIGLKMSKA